MRVVLAFLALLPLARAAPADPTGAARDVLQRLIGSRSSAFQLRVIAPAAAGLDVYEIEAHGGVVFVAGNSPVALAHGAYAYLRADCHCFQGWEGEHLELPAVFPDCARERVVSPYALRPYYNVCTFGYTTAFWDWPRWQRELDWMALHGINFALAEVATEAIWQRVWREEGIAQADLDQYFPGPAYMPWHRMGNINRWQGPPPRSYFPKQVALEKAILGRMRALGIEPIAPAFAGFAPPALQKLHPEVTLQKLSGWAGFTPAYGTYLVDPVSPLFSEIGRRFIHAWESEFGPARYFLADSFNELKVPVPADQAGRLAQLARYGEAVYRSILAGEPGGTWIMQGWLFYNDAAFWDQASAAALLSRVPNDRMVILDLACDFRPIWSSREAFYGKQWVYSVIHNFGGKSSLGGDLTFFAGDSAKTLAAPNHGHLVGSGLAPEGVENNEVVYELLTDAMWSAQPIPLRPWLRGYAHARYGGCPDEMALAWDLLVRSCYGQDVHFVRPIYQYAPLSKPNPKYRAPVDSPDFHRAVQLFLACAPTLGANPLYRADALELTVQYLGSRVDRQFAAALAAHGRGDSPERDRCASAALALLADMDLLLTAHPTNRLERWIGFARAWGDTPAESDYFEANAKWLITRWGGTISEYSSRTWSGLLREYYRPRWEKTFQQMRTGANFDLIAWETQWIETPGAAPNSPPPRAPLALCSKFLRAGEEAEAKLRSFR